LAEHVADFARADADVAGRHVDVGADVPVELCHEALAEAHHFAVGFALRVEVGAALAAPDGEAGQGVFEDLLEPEELDNAHVDGRVEPQPALVRTDGTVELDAEPAVDPDIALVVHPRDAEHDGPLRLHQPLKQTRLGKFRMLVKHRRQGVQNFVNGLMEFGFARVPPDDGVVDFVHIFLTCGKRQTHVALLLFPYANFCINEFAGRPHRNWGERSGPSRR